MTQRTPALTFLASLTLSRLALKLKADLHAPESYKGDLHAPTDSLEFKGDLHAPQFCAPSSCMATCTPQSPTRVTCMPPQVVTP